MLKISLIICTYNRAELLNECLKSITSKNQQVEKSQFEVIVVDNNSTDNTKEIIRSYENSEGNFYYVFETNSGLSYARNTGAIFSKSDWLFYLDDDALADNQLISKAIECIEESKYICIGGTYKSWFRETKPNWFKKEYGDKYMPIDIPCEMPHGYYASGGVMLIKKDVLPEAGWFPVEIGMNGNRISYGEETVVQKRLLEMGYKIGYNPTLLIYHYVAPYKYKIGWHINSAFAQGRDFWEITKTIPSLKKLLLIYPARIIKGVFLSTPLYIINNFGRKIYWQNWLIEEGKDIIKNYSIIKSGLKARISGR